MVSFDENHEITSVCQSRVPPPLWANQQKSRQGQGAVYGWIAVGGN
jgi:hypothetical protein